jgi:hypothetical protein
MTAILVPPAFRLPERDSPRRDEIDYRVVTALRADPRVAAEALSADFYLAAIDQAADRPRES